MRIAAGLIFAGAVSLCATGAAWSQTPAPKSNAAPAATAAPAPVPAPAKAPCANPDALGVGVHAHDLAFDGLRIVPQVDRVVEALPHLLAAVDARQ